MNHNNIHTINTAIIKVIITVMHALLSLECLALPMISNYTVFSIIIFGRGITKVLPYKTIIIIILIVVT